jgi:hypothetical protein
MKFHEIRFRQGRWPRPTRGRRRRRSQCLLIIQFTGRECVCITRTSSVITAPRAITAVDVWAILAVLNTSALVLLLSCLSLGVHIVQCLQWEEKTEVFLLPQRDGFNEWIHIHVCLDNVGFNLAPDEWWAVFARVALILIFFSSPSPPPPYTQRKTD